MRFRVLQSIYQAQCLSSFKPRTLKYKSNCKKLEQLHISLQATLNDEQIAAVERYTTLIYSQCLAEQKKSFYYGVKVGAGLVRELSSLKKGDK